MWARNLLLLGVVAAAAAGLRATLLPHLTPARRIAFDPPPADEALAAVVRDVDAAFRYDWDQRGLTPAPYADELTLARRLSLALTGTIPSLEEIRQFQAAPPQHRLAGWIEHLLRDRRHADYFAERLARVYVGAEDGPVLRFRKRRFKAWLADELHRNTSYAELVRRMIAERGLNTDRPAVNFVAAAYDEDRQGPDAEKLTVRVARAFLGLRLDCAQCHDYYDPTDPQFDADGQQLPTWSQRQFQSLAAFFGQTRHVVTHVGDGEGVYRYEDRVHGGTHEIEPAVPFLPELLPDHGTRRERLAAWVTHPSNGYFARATVNRVWAMLFGRPLLGRFEVRTPDEPVHPALERLAADFAAHGHDLRRLIRVIAATEAFRLASAAPFSVTEDHERAFAVFPLTRLRPEQVIGSVIQAASVRTIDQRSNPLVRAVRFFHELDFVQRYGDADDDEFLRDGVTLPQVLLMMNGELVAARAREELLNACTQIAWFAPDDAAAVETAYLTVLTRRPTRAERDHFVARLAGTTGPDRAARLADLFWALFNSLEMAHHH